MRYADTYPPRSHRMPWHCRRPILGSLALLLAAGCATNVERDVSVRSVSDLVRAPVAAPLPTIRPVAPAPAASSLAPPPRVLAPPRLAAPEVVAPPAIAKPASGKIGIALAGGGTKAASYGMGVLAGLADTGLYPRVDVISTVSGGGYAAFFLYSKLMLGQSLSQGKPELRHLFADCLPYVYRGLLPSGLDPERLCPQTLDDARMNAFRFQQFVRCRQDVLENNCDPGYDGSDGTEYANALVLTAASALAFVPNFVARTLFDWPVTMSPSREAYMQGIGSAYGLFPLSATALRQSRDLSETCGDHFLNCSSDTGPGLLVRDHIRFWDWKQYSESAEGQRMPEWIINATASPNRSIFGWARAGRRDFTKYTLRISARGAHSGFYGEIKNFGTSHGRDFDLLDAVTSSAAFFDSNQTALAQPGRMLAALGMHAFALDWGIDIPNPNVHPIERYAHTMLPLWPWPWTTPVAVPNLPFPTYFADGLVRELRGRRDNQSSAFIRLLDGGNNDNLGAYTLVPLGMQHLVISDHAQDSEGRMSDLCMLHNEVRLRGDPNQPGRPKRLLVPGLQDFARHCLDAAKESECGDAACDAIPGVKGSALAAGGYPIDRWKHRVLLGCIVDGNRDGTVEGRPAANMRDDTAGDCEGDADTRLYILKPALDRAAFDAAFIEGGKVSKFACEGEDSSACEVAAYLLRKIPADSGKQDPGSFPQHTTVGMTFASNAARYGAYRELARWQMQKAARFLYGQHDFVAEAMRQRCDPIKRVLASGDQAAPAAESTAGGAACPAPGVAHRP